MIQATEQLYIELEANLEKIGNQGVCLHQIEQCYHTCDNATQVLKKMVNVNGFSCQQEEILFFKFSKPGIVSLQTYYFQLYNYALFKPDDPVERLTYLKRSLAKLDNYLINHHWFYAYYISGCSCLDHEYFLRTDDDDFNTTGDKLVSDLFAHLLFAKYIQREMENLN